MVVSINTVEKNKMVTKINIAGCITDYNRIIHSVDEPIGLCSEEPLEVLRRLAHTHIIHDYKGFMLPFYPGAIGTGQYGLSINNECIPTKGCEVSVLDELIPKVDLPRKVSPVDPKSLQKDDPYRSMSERDPWYTYNPSKVEFSLRLRRNLTDTQLRNRFRERLLEELESHDWKATEKEYWLELDQRLFEGMHLCGRIPYPKYEKIFQDLQLNEDIWDRNVRIKQILPQLRKIDGYNMEKERRSYDRVNKQRELKILLELLGLFSLEQATYHDLEDLIMAK